MVEDGYRVVYENTKIIDKKEAIENDCPVFLQATDLETPFINTNNLFHVDNADWERYPKGRIKKGEILIEVKGKIDKVSIVPNDFPIKALVSGSLFKLSVNDKISKHVLLTYMISKFGIAFKDRYKTNLLISFISKPDLYRIPVPTFGSQFEKFIDNLYEEIFISKRTSEKIYNQAQNLLIEHIGLKNFEFSNESINVKSFKQSFLNSNRLDAEYYQPKYDEIINHITNQPFDVLNNLVNIKKSIEPGSMHYSEDEGLPFYRVSDVSKFGLLIPDKKLTNSFVENNKTEIYSLLPPKGTILLTKDGSIGIAYLLREDLLGITSSALLHLEVKNKRIIIPAYLTLVLNSQIVQMQAERDSSGSIISHWRKEEIERVVVPLIAYDIQKQIAELVEESFRLKSRGEDLLDLAKQAIEIAIELNEEKAIKFINENN